MVVLGMLTLMAIVGLAFVMRAESEATAARYHRESLFITDPGPAVYAANYADLTLAQVIYPVPTTQAQSGLNGYELSRTMYGYNSSTPNANLSLFSGVGPWRATDAYDSMTLPDGVGPFPRSGVINHAYKPGSGYYIDPEWQWFRTTPGGAFDVSFPGMMGMPITSPAYRSIAAPYTFPDLKDLILAVVDPTTGRISQASLYRDGTFNSGNQATPNSSIRLAPPGSNGVGSPAADDWLNAAGRLKIIRPRPIDHEYPTGSGSIEFPYPSMNPDGSYTGDVQNIRHPSGLQRNDAIWVYPGGPVRSWNGKKYTALVALTVVDMNGRVDLSVAGNRKGASNAHSSGPGVGPFEINPTKVFADTMLPPGSAGPYDHNASQALAQLLGDPTGAYKYFGGPNGSQPIIGRYGWGTNPGGMAPDLSPPSPYPNTPINPQFPNPPLDRVRNTNTYQFTAGTNQAPHYSQVDFDGKGSGGMTHDRMSPVGASAAPFTPFPTYPNTRYNTASEYTQHPAQFNPDTWSNQPSPLGRMYSPVDMRWLAAEYAARPADYSRAGVTQLAPRHLGSANFSGTTSYPTPGPFTVTDPANLVRQLVTTDSSTIWRPELTVAAAGGGTARLGPIDLNRPLRGYTTGTPAQYTYDKLTDPMAGQLAQAIRDRQRLARDIFVRLAAVAGQIDGTNVSYSATPPSNPTSETDPNADYGYLRLTGAANLNNLRPLAQIAANIVDYVDDDDVSTVFVWNPYNGGNYFDPLSYDTSWPSAPTANLVFGTELPRIALNEAYAAITNERTDNGANGAKPLETRFWVELHNPLSNDAVLSDNGAARLHVQTGISPGTTTLGSSYSPYQLQIVESTNNAVANEVHRSANVFGDLPAMTQPALEIGKIGSATEEYVFDPAENAKDQGMLSGTDELYLVRTHNAAAGGAKNKAYYVLGPRDDFPGTDIFASIRLPDPAGQAMTPPASMTIVSTTATPTQAELTNLTGKRYAVVLRRLANPYLPPQTNPQVANYNPYVTVDCFDGIIPKDRVTLLTTGPRGGFMPNDDPSRGRKHPYAAATAKVEDQGMGAGMGAAPPNTFFNPNNGGTPPSLDTPQAWLAHLDRKLIHPLEAATVSAFGPAQLTSRFYSANQYHGHSAESLFLPGLTYGSTVVTQAEDIPNGQYGYGPAGSPLYTSAGQLYRALDMLTVRPHHSGSPVGGRRRGLVNVNTMTHAAVARALFDALPPPNTMSPGAPDPTASNWFTEWEVRQSAPMMGAANNSIWARLTGSDAEARTFGTPNTGTNPVHTSPGDPVYGLAASQGIGQTIYRDVSGRRLFYNSMAAQSGAGDTTHSAIVTEPLGKMWNSSTTISNNFLVVMTVGFFEVRHVDPSGRIYLGRELFRDTPSDLRAKFVAIVDRNNLAVETNTPTQQADEVPWFTTLAEDLIPGDTTIRLVAGTDDTATPTLAYALGNGRPMPSGLPGTPTTSTGVLAFDLQGQDPVTGMNFNQNLQNRSLRIGFGDATLNNGDGSVITTQAMTGWSNGVATLQLQGAGATRYYPAGTPVGNVLLGNPGPQPEFSYSSSRYKGVVPYFAPVRASE